MAYLKKILRLVRVSLLLLSAACSFGPTETTAPRTYFLNPELSWTNPQGRSERIGTSVLLITQPKPQAGFDTARMAYLLRPYEISYYAVNQWAETPARILHQIMVENLDKTGLWSAVLQTPGAVPAQYRLDCDNLVLEQQFLSRPSRVRLALRAQLSETKKQSILGSRNFAVVETAPSEDAYGGVIAANHAAEKLLVQMAEWLATISKDTK